MTGFAAGDRVIAIAPHGGYAEQAVVDAQPLRGDAGGDALRAWRGVSGGFRHVPRRLVASGAVARRRNAGGAWRVRRSGLTAVAIGKRLGARVIATASSPDKLEVARQHGADHLIDTSREDVRSRIKELTAGRGADVVYDPVGGELFAASLRSIAFEGRILVIGFAGGTVPQIPANHLLVKNVDVIGLNWPAYAELIRRS